MSKIFLTGDLHLGHTNVVKYCNRPFDDIDSHDEQLIWNWNHTVSNGDLVYVLGDICLCNTDRANDMLSKLNGQKYLIFGNHDEKLTYLKDHFIWTKHYERIKVKDDSVHGGKQHIVLFHYACRVWDRSHYCSWMLHGHSHNSLPDDPNALSIDVGVDAVAARIAAKEGRVVKPEDYRPISYEEVKEIMSTKTYKPVDHHEDRD